MVIHIACIKASLAWSKQEGISVKCQPLPCRRCMSYILNKFEQVVGVWGGGLGLGLGFQMGKEGRVLGGSPSEKDWTCVADEYGVGAAASLNKFEHVCYLSLTNGITGIGHMGLPVNRMTDKHNWKYYCLFTTSLADGINTEFNGLWSCH